jgi:hypothetical protein
MEKFPNRGDLKEASYSKNFASSIGGMVLMVLLSGVLLIPALMSSAHAATTNTLTVRAYTTAGEALSMYAVIKSGSTTVKSGFTPLAYTGTTNRTYTVTMSNYKDFAFSYWGGGSGSSNPRTLTLWGDTTATAYYKTAATSTTSSSSTGISALIPKTGVLVSLYMYPGSTGSAHWQKVIDEKKEHPSVPIVAIFNPSNGPGSSKNSNIAYWVDRLQDAGVIAVGYVYDNYGSRSLSGLKADADKYKNWYGADGLFIDEFTNKAGYESHYRSVTTYAKSLVMKMTIGNPGTDVPKSYIGTVDVINITEGSGYMPISWLQYCVLCTSSGWHDDYDKRNFAFVRYGISWLDKSFVVNSSKWVGLMYITSGTTSDGRWFYLPSNYGDLVATLDR